MNKKIKKIFFARGKKKKFANTKIFGNFLGNIFLGFFPPCDFECLGLGFGVRVRVRARVIGPACALWRG